jgi:hypothetical protein
MNPTDRLMAMAQIWITIIFLSFTFVMLMIYELGWAHLTEAQDKSFSNSLNWLEGAALILIYFWFQRTRTSGIPDPSQVVTQTHTLPDGTKTVITSPSATTPVPTSQTIVLPIAKVDPSIPLAPTQKDIPK